MTDELRSYETIGRSFAEHKSISHGRGEYVVGDLYTNTVEGYFSILSGINGVYHHVSRAPPRPLPERVRLPLQPAPRDRLHADRCGARRGRGEAPHLPGNL